EPFDQGELEFERVHLFRRLGHQRSSTMDSPPQIEKLHRRVRHTQDPSRRFIRDALLKPRYSGLALLFG
ncbi:hypothetical protein, partial [Arthrobacter sp. 49Tsu3.1M3]|uniref:hypothetical protein n=1 Tax=Arthrobacter sp. 49Tsu3.1M3 TaxID=1279029 RepID=UPI001C4E0920